MSRILARQSDVTEALEGVRAAGHEPKAVKITITVEIGIAEKQEEENFTALEDWRRQRARQT